MSTELIHLGFSNMVAINKAVAVVSPNSTHAKRLVQEGRNRGMVIDVTHGRRTKAVLVMDSGHTILAAITPETIASRVLAGRRSDPKGQLEEREQGEIS